MPHFRVTFRYGAAQSRYEVLDLEAADLRAAMREAAERVAEEVVASAELVEVRVQPSEEDREYVEG